MLSKKGRLRREETCAEVDDTSLEDPPVRMVDCPTEPTEKQKWLWTEVYDLLLSR